MRRIFIAIMLVTVLFMLIWGCTNQEGNLPIETQEPVVEEPAEETHAITSFVKDNQLPFNDYINNGEEYYDEKITLVGRLKHSIEGGYHTRSLVDEEGSEIVLTKLDKDMTALFPQESTSEVKYSVLGSFRRVYGGIELETYKITLD